jgi:hypothetical protein
VIDISFNSGTAFRRCRDIRLPRHPGEQRFRFNLIAFRKSRSIRPKRRGKCRCHSRDGSQSLFHQFIGTFHQRGWVELLAAAVLQKIFFKGKEPRIDNRSEGSLFLIGGGQSLHQTAINRFEPMKWRLGLADLNLCNRKPAAFGAFLKPTREECLPAAVLTADRFQHSRTSANGIQFAING